MESCTHVRTVRTGSYASDNESFPRNLPLFKEYLKTGQTGNFLSHPANELEGKTGRGTVELLCSVLFVITLGALFFKFSFS